MELKLDIFDLSGRFVKNISREAYVSDGYRVNDIEWDGQDNQGGDLAPGMYVYKLKLVFSADGKQETIESDGEKLVIIR
jgi:flagellar hook assembly protein FlgD